MLLNAIFILLLDAASPVASVPTGKVTARKQVAMELLQTETNYVGILSTILKVS